MSAAKKGLYVGQNHPNYGNTAFNAHAVFVYNLDDELVAQFPSMSAAANF